MACSSVSACQGWQHKSVTTDGLPQRGSQSRNSPAAGLNFFLHWFANDKILLFQFGFGADGWLVPTESDERKTLTKPANNSGSFHTLVCSPRINQLRKQKKELEFCW
ncbi:unnamed protein product [Sphagnum jensenii]|uniref:Uncharacterized protein n=1 Tax=Sphagnum jensenii TaxID=128206 RepID=A0ABP0W729_9BRYO